MFCYSSRWYRLAANDGLNKRLQLNCVLHTAVYINAAFNTVNLQISFNICKIMLKFPEHAVHIKEVRNCYEVFVGEIVDVIGG